MNDWRLEDAFAPVPDVVQEHIDKAIMEVHNMNQKHRKPMLAVIVAVAAVLVLAGTAVAAGIRWGALDFFTAGVFHGETLPEAQAMLQTDIRQEGGVTDWAVFTVREALCDGRYAWLVFDVTPTDEETLLVSNGMSPQAAANNYASELPGDMTVAQWAEANGYTRIMEVTITQQKSQSGNRYEPARSSWHTEKNGALTFMYRMRCASEDDAGQGFTCTVMPRWTAGYDSFVPQTAQLTVALEYVSATLWTASWKGEMPIPDSEIVVEEVTLTGTAVGVYSEIIFSMPEPEERLMTWLYPVDEQGKRLSESAGDVFGLKDGQSFTSGGTERLGNGRYRSYGSYAAMAEAPETIGISGMFEFDRLNAIKLPLE